MHSKDILIASLTYFLSLVIFEQDDFILDQCAVCIVRHAVNSYDFEQGFVLKKCVGSSILTTLMIDDDFPFLLAKMHSAVVD